MTSAKVLLFLRPDRDGGPRFRVATRTFRFPRLPVVGEIASLGNDGDGIAADYEVVLVHHCPLRPNGIDAEVYLSRVYLPDVLQRAATNAEPAKAHWNAASWPVEADGEAEPSG